MRDRFRFRCRFRLSLRLSREINVKYIVKLQTYCCLGVAHALSLSLFHSASLSLSLSYSHGQRMLLYNGGGCDRAKRNETKTENAQKDEMKTQRKRETKETKAKGRRDNGSNNNHALSGQQRQQPRSFQLNEMMCL